MKKTSRPVSVVEEKSQQENDVFLSKKKKSAALIDLMLQIQRNNPEEISDDEIREETDTFMFAVSPKPEFSANNEVKNLS